MANRAAAAAHRKEGHAVAPATSWPLLNSSIEPARVANHVRNMHAELWPIGVDPGLVCARNPVDSNGVSFLLVSTEFSAFSAALLLLAWR